MQILPHTADEKERERKKKRKKLKDFKSRILLPVTETIRLIRDGEKVGKGEGVWR